MARDLNIFISHSLGSHDELLRLRNLLNARPYFRSEFSEVSKDIPINSVNADYIKRVLEVHRSGNQHRTNHASYHSASHYQRQGPAFGRDAVCCGVRGTTRY